MIYQKKKHKISKTIKNDYLSTKQFCKPKHFDIKSVITEHPKILHELRMTISPIAKVGSISSLSSDAKK